MHNHNRPIRFHENFAALERAVPDIAPRPILFIHGSDDPRFRLIRRGW